MGAEHSTLTAPEAAAALALARATVRRSRRVAAGRFMHARLIYWGFAWMAGYAGAQYLAPHPLLLLWVALIAAGAVYSFWLWRPGAQRAVVTGWEGRLGRAWLIFFAGSAALAAVVQPASTMVVMLQIGALWGIGYLLYGTAMQQREISVLGGGIVAAAVLLRVVAPGSALLLFGLGAGGGMVVVGTLRVRRAW